MGFWKPLPCTAGKIFSISTQWEHTHKGAVSGNMDVIERNLLPELLYARTESLFCKRNSFSGRPDESMYYTCMPRTGFPGVNSQMKVREAGPAIISWLPRLILKMEMMMHYGFWEIHITEICHYKLDFVFLNTKYL